MTPTRVIKQNLSVPETLENTRFDKVLAVLLSDYSRNQLSKWIKQGNILVDGQPKRAKDHIRTNQIIELRIPEETQTIDQPEAIDLDIVYEDAQILVLNKPAGLTVHPGAGQSEHTLVNGLLHHSECFAQLPRSGIVHRLDKLTSGLMVVAKTLVSHIDLVRQLRNRLVKRRYLCVVNGVPITGFSVDGRLGRHPRNRQKMAVLQYGGKVANTDFVIIQKYRKHALLEAQLGTGRTHQIRVHLSHAGYSVVGDQTYGKRIVVAKNMLTETINLLTQFNRQALHSYDLRLQHPTSKVHLQFKADMPTDIQNLVDELQRDLNNA